MTSFIHEWIQALQPSALGQLISRNFTKYSCFTMQPVIFFYYKFSLILFLYTRLLTDHLFWNIYVWTYNLDCSWKRLSCILWNHSECVLFQLFFVTAFKVRFCFEFGPNHSSGNLEEVEHIFSPNCALTRFMWGISINIWGSRRL